MRSDRSLNFLFIVLLCNCFVSNKQVLKISEDNFDSLIELREFSKKFDEEIHKIRIKSRIVEEKLRLDEFKEDFALQNTVFVQQFSSIQNDKKTNTFNPSRKIKDLQLALLSMNEETKAKTTRFLFTFLIVAVCSTLSFLLVKSSVDWAGNSKIELNRMRDEELTRITEEINQKYQINKGNLE